MPAHYFGRSQVSLCGDASIERTSFRHDVILIGQQPAEDVCDRQSARPAHQPLQFRFIKGSYAS